MKDKMIDGHHNAKGLIAWNPVEKRILRGYHEAGFNAQDVAGFMFKTDEPTKKQISKIIGQAGKQGVSLKRNKNVIK